MQSLTARAVAQRAAVPLVRCPAWTSPCILLLPTPTVATTRRTLLPTTLGPTTTTTHGFATSAVQRKKGGGGGGGGGKKDKSSSSSNKPDKRGKVSTAEAAEDAEDGGGGTHPAPDPADPFSFADVESRWQRSDAHHEEKFKELQRAFRGGMSGGGGGGGGGGGEGDGGEGGVDVEAIGATPVVVREEGGHGHGHGHGHDSKGKKGKKQAHAHTQEAAATDKDTAAVPLSQLALILPRPGGRVVELRMHSPASRKAIVSAVQTSPLFHGQQPQPDPDDELVLLVKLGGPAPEGAGKGSGDGGGAAAAAEAAAARTRRVHELANAWRAQIRRATARRQKTHQAWKKDKTVQPDDLHRLERELLKGQEKRMARIDAAEKEALRQLERVGRR